MTTVTVRKTFQRYDPDQVLQFHREIQREFGRLNKDWSMTVSPFNMLDQSWPVDYTFKNPEQATLFVLKYL